MISQLKKNKRPIKKDYSALKEFIAENANKKLNEDKIKRYTFLASFMLRNDEEDRELQDLFLDLGSLVDDIEVLDRIILKASE